MPREPFQQWSLLREFLIHEYYPSSSCSFVVTSLCLPGFLSKILEPHADYQHDHFTLSCTAQIPQAIRSREESEDRTTSGFRVRVNPILDSEVSLKILHGNASSSAQRADIFTHSMSCMPASSVYLGITPSFKQNTHAPAFTPANLGSCYMLARHTEHISQPDVDFNNRLKSVCQDLKSLIPPIFVES